jgi:hypothetical protein
MQAGGEAIAQSNLSSPLRDVHHIVHYGPGPAPKSISNIAFDVSAQSIFFLPESFFTLKEKIIV